MRSHHHLCGYMHFLVVVLCFVTKTLNLISFATIWYILTSLCEDGYLDAISLRYNHIGVCASYSWTSRASNVPLRIAWLAPSLVWFLRQWSSGPFVTLHIHKLIVHQFECNNKYCLLNTSFFLHFGINVEKWNFLGFVHNILKVYGSQP